VGSEDAISHIGTGLHKVPLARLQEVFLSALGTTTSKKSNKNNNNKNRIELSEVIRLLGPFPNVKRTLQLTIQIQKNNTKKNTNNNRQQQQQQQQYWTGSSMGRGRKYLQGLWISSVVYHYK
jgi:hypothetical protein